MARRSRANFELWDSVDIPLGEEGEAYELDINRNGEVVRTLHSTQPWFHYPSEMELRDFGERQAGLSVSVYQMSALLGRGIPASSFVSIK